MRTDKTTRELLWFFALLVGFTALFFFALVKSNNYFLFMYGYMWSPSLAALGALAVNRSGFRNLWLEWGPFRLLVWSALIPLGYGALTYAPMWAAGLAGFKTEALLDAAKKMGTEDWPLPLSTLIFVPLRAFFGTLGNMPSSFGEELGWRGFLAPRLRTRLSYAATALVVGAVWGAWHYPLIIKNHNPASPLPLAVAMLDFTLMTVGLSFIFNWMSERARSVWPAVVLHSAHNFFILSLFDGWTRFEGRADWFASETGVLLPVALLLFAAAFWANRKRLAEPPASLRPDGTQVC